MRYSRSTSRFITHVWLVFTLINMAIATNTATSVISFVCPASIDITVPASVPIVSKAPYPSTGMSSNYITVNSNVAWSLNVAANNGGHMNQVSGGNILTNPMTIYYDGDDPTGTITPPGSNPFTLSGTPQTYVSGLNGVSIQVPVTFMQQFVKGEKPGSYKISLTWSAAPVP